MITKEQLKKAYVARDWDVIEQFYDENKTFIEKIYKYVWSVQSHNTYLINEFKGYSGKQVQ
jgi:hypothetical protein